MSNGKPDPNCKECNGTGVITLFTSSRECECVNTVQWAEIKESLEPRDFMEEFLLEPEL